MTSKTKAIISITLFVILAITAVVIVLVAGRKDRYHNIDRFDDKCMVIHTLDNDDVCLSMRVTEDETRHIVLATCSHFDWEHDFRYFEDKQEIRAFDDTCFTRKTKDE